MAIRTSYDAQVTINSVDLSDHVNKVSVNGAVETKAVRVMGTAYEMARPGYQTPSFEVEFYNDHTSGKVESTARSLAGIVASSSGFAVAIKWSSGSLLGTSNPVYNMTAILDGDLNFMDDEAGELPMFTMKFLPFSSFSVSTTTS